MKNQPNSDTAPDMLPEYDFTDKKGVRGKYFQTSKKGHTVRVTEKDGTVVTQHFTLEDGAVLNNQTKRLTNASVEAGVMCESE